MAEPERHDREQRDQRDRARTARTAKPAGQDASPGGGERGMAVLAHLLGIILSILGPLLVLLTAGRTSTYVRDQAREAVNFQFTVLAAFVVALIAFFIFIGPVLLVVVAIADVVLCIAAAVRAAQGAAWRYPMGSRLVR